MYNRRQHCSVSLFARGVRIARLLLFVYQESLGESTTKIIKLFSVLNKPCFALTYFKDVVGH